MTNKLTSTIKYLLLIIAIIGITSPVSADGIKDRMKARLSTINELKAQGAIGENNQGFLEIKNSSANKQIVDAENADRLAVYTAIAKKQGVDPAFVGQRRAAQIFEIADPGHLIQDQSGKWLKK